MERRESGIDLTRCVGLLLVVSEHFFLWNGFYYRPQTGAAMAMADGAVMLAHGCNGIFMMLTGYLKGEKPLNRHYYRGLLPVLLSYVLAALISIPVRILAFGERYTAQVWVAKFFGFGGVYYGWYVEMYIGLLLISPILNLALGQVSGRRGALWLGGTMVFLTALPSITPLGFLPDYWEGLYPLTYYVLGALIARHRPRVRPAVCFGIAALTAVGTGLISFFSDGGGTYVDCLDQHFGSFWVTVIAVALFLGLYRLEPGPRLGRCLCWMAGGVYEGYLLSHLLDAWVYRPWKEPGKYGLAWLLTTVPVFLLSILMGKGLHGVTVKICACIRREKAVS